MSKLRHLKTPAGDLPFPAYIPVTTFGTKFPLDSLIQPYLPRIAPAVMVSYHYAQQMTSRPRIPMMVDSGGFAAIFEGSVVREDENLGVLTVHLGDEPEELTPWDVLDIQEEVADIAFTLDFPIPPGTDATVAKLRHELTIKNAHWALRNRRRPKMPIYGCIQGWDLDSFRACAQAYADQPFDGVALGGMVSRAKDRKLVLAIIDTVRSQIPDLPLHLFGLGHPGFLPELYAAGVDSVDSSSYVKAAVDGLSWLDSSRNVTDPSPPERMRLALENLAFASGHFPPNPLQFLRT